jgi:hypothetical protein
MAPTLEILKASATDLYRQEGAKSVQGLIDILANTDGALASVPTSFLPGARWYSYTTHSTYIGTELKDPDTWWLVVGRSSHLGERALYVSDPLVT